MTFTTHDDFSIFIFVHVPIAKRIEPKFNKNTMFFSQELSRNIRIYQEMSKILLQEYPSCANR